LRIIRLTVSPTAVGRRCRGGVSIRSNSGYDPWRNCCVTFSKALRTALSALRLRFAASHRPCCDSLACHLVTGSLQRCQKCIVEEVHEGRKEGRCDGGEVMRLWDKGLITSESVASCWYSSRFILQHSSTNGDDVMCECSTGYGRSRSTWLHFSGAGTNTLAQSRAVCNNIQY
jgi:hypothetical protein